MCAYHTAIDADHLLLSSLGFAHVDTRLDFVALTSNVVSQYRVAGAGDADELIKWSRGTFLDSRFYADEKFDRTKVDELFQLWVQNSFGELADAVLVPINSLDAFVTVNLESADVARIGLIGVAEHARGQGLGRSMVRAALSWANGTGAKRLFVATQERNNAARSLYESVGFTLASRSETFHWWA